jgi:hypothetical protein
MNESFPSLQCPLDKHVLLGEDALGLIALSFSLAGNPNPDPKLRSSSFL